LARSFGSSGGRYIQVASAGTRLYSALSSVRSKARKLSIAETASNDKAALLVLQFIASSREDVNRNMLELVSGFERTRLDHILKLFFRQGKIMVDFGTHYYLWQERGSSEITEEAACRMKTSPVSQWRS
jgi:hypothetical protein